MDAVDQQVVQLQKDVEGMLDGLQKQHLMPMQKQVFLCSARCCDTESTTQQLQSCVERCSMMMMSAQKIVHSTLGDHQERFQRCAIRCEDRAKDTLSSKPSDRDMERAQGMMKQCVSGCVGEYANKLPSIKVDLEQQLRQI